MKIRAWNYWISKDGRIFNKTGKEIFADNNGKGYLSVRLWKNNQAKKLTVHRLVAQSFIPNPENKEYVNHINGIKTDNRIENLEWVTPSESMIHAYKKGLMVKKKGSDSVNSLLLEQEVKEIKFLLKNTDLCQKRIGEEYSISQSAISNIKNGKTWSWLSE